MITINKTEDDKYFEAFNYQVIDLFKHRADSLKNQESLKQ